jgi:hypothetical protein
MARTSSMPKSEMPRSNPVVTSREASSAASAPNSVRLPVRTTIAVPVPLLTCVPRKTALDRPDNPASAATVPGHFSAG